MLFSPCAASPRACTRASAAAQVKLADPIVTEIVKAGPFYPAERYHQDYYQLNKNRNPYCQIVIAPKLQNLGMDR